MQEASSAAAAGAEPGRRAAQHQFAGVDLRRPKGYAAPAPAPAVGEGDPCPRCASRDTKFCYYNNYNTSQPRHFCKGCRRYWTKGGTLRNVPVGGGTRKKPSSSSSSSSYAAAADADRQPKKKPASKKRRVVAPAPELATAADPGKTATTTTTTTTTSEITTETGALEDSDSLAHLLLQPGTEDAEAVALGLGLSDFPSAGKAVLDDEDSFVWPAASFDMGACWAGAGFADPDPACIFLNLP
jgi:hypothetical protein